MIREDRELAEHVEGLRAAYDLRRVERILTGTGILVASTLFVLMVYFAAVIDHARLARYIIIVTAGLCYLAYLAQYHPRGFLQSCEGTFVSLSIFAGIAAAIALLAGV